MKEVCVGGYCCHAKWHHAPLKRQHGTWTMPPPARPQPEDTHKHRPLHCPPPPLFPCSPPPSPRLSPQHPMTCPPPTRSTEGAATHTSRGWPLPPLVAPAAASPPPPRTCADGRVRQALRPRRLGLVLKGGGEAVLGGARRGDRHAAPHGGRGDAGRPGGAAAGGGGRGAGSRCGGGGRFAAAGVLVDPITPAPCGRNQGMDGVGDMRRCSNMLAAGTGRWPAGPTCASWLPRPYS